MPVILELFLSKSIFIILAWIYLIGSFIVIFGFKYFKIVRRVDVKFRGSIMNGTFIFLSHSIGVMALSMFYLFLKINSIYISRGILFVLIMITIVISDIIYIFFSNYLWDRLAIEKVESNKLSIYSLILVTPWYFVFNIY